MSPIYTRYAWIVSALCLVVAALVQSRAFVAGYAISTALLFLYAKEAVFGLKRLLWLLAGGMVTIFLLAFFFKTDSSLGRMLIYKISFQLLRDHWLTGVGWGQFEVAYGDYQAAFFKSGQYTERELLLADNTRFAFNDYLQWTIETGAAGFCLLLVSLIVIVLLIRKGFRRNPGWPFLLATGQVVALGVAAAFTHVLEKPGFQLLLLLCLLIIVHITLPNRNTRKFCRLAGTFLLFFVAWWHWGGYLLHYSAYRRYQAARQSYSAGYVSEALHTYADLYPALHKDLFYATQYASALMGMEQYAAAVRVLEQLAIVTNSSAIQVKLATCYQQLHAYAAAEAAYEKAVYTVPNRFTYRYLLFNFYKDTGQRQKAISAARALAALPVKIPSHQIDAIRQEVKEWLHAALGVSPY